MLGSWRQKGSKEWSKLKIKKRNKSLNRLAYLEWQKENYEKTADYSLDYFFKVLEEIDFEKIEKFVI